MRNAVARIALALLLCTAASAQVTVTFSHQPIQSFEAAIGPRLSGIALYSATACSVLQRNLSGGLIQQQAEIAGKLNVVAPALAFSTGNRSRNRSGLSRFLNVLKWASVGAAVIVAAKGASPGLIEGFTFGAGAIQVIDTTLAPSNEAAQQAFLSVLGQLLNPGDTIAVPAGGCVSKVFFGDYIPGWKPISTTLQ